MNANDEPAPTRYLRPSLRLNDRRLL